MFQKRNVIVCLTLWPLRMWIATCQLHNANLLQAIGSIEYASVVCCSAQL